MRWRVSSNPLLQRPGLWAHHRVMLIAFVQRVISPFDKHLGPFDERGGEETGKGTDEDLLEECGVHRPFYSSGGARTAQSLAMAIYGGH
jgi:hypothetical protein